MRPFLALLPRKLAQRFPTLRGYFPLQVKHLFNVVVSVVIGAVSHLVWDDFTHEGGWFVTHSKLLQSQLGSLPIYKLLQYGCGVIGVFALLLWLSIWLNQAKSRNRIETLAPRWRSLTIICIVLCAVVFAWVAVEINRIAGETFKEAVVRAVIGCISGLFLGLLLYSVVFWMLKSFKPNSRAT
jgi:cytochrome bd-type quinol oxidase subunit 2